MEEGCSEIAMFVFANSILWPAAVAGAFYACASMMSRAVNNLRQSACYELWVAAKSPLVLLRNEGSALSRPLPEFFIRSFFPSFISLFSFVSDYLALTDAAVISSCIMLSLVELFTSSFSSRALYDRVAETELDLSFKKDDILYVDDTLPNGHFGSWMAWQLDENAQKIQRGQIPSKYMWVTPSKDAIFRKSRIINTFM